MSLASNLALARARTSERRAWKRRHNAKYPFRNRWHICRGRAKAKTPRTWSQVWEDFVYLVRG